MSRKLCRWLAMSFCLVGMNLANAGVSNATVDRLFELSGLSAQVGYFPEMVVTGLDQAAEQGGAMPREDYDLIVTSVERAVVPADILAAVRFALRSSLSEEDAEFLLDWYRSPIGRRVTLAEEHASSPQGYAHSMAQGGTIEDPERIAHAERLEKLMGLTDFTIAVQENTSVAVYAGVLAALQPHQPTDLEAIKLQVRGLLQQSRPAIHQAVVQSSAYSYRDISLGDLDAYVRFLEDPRTQRFNDRVMAGLGGGLEDSVARLGTLLGQAFSQRR